MPWKGFSIFVLSILFFLVIVFIMIAYVFFNPAYHNLAFNNYFNIIQIIVDLFGIIVTIAIGIVVGKFFQKSASNEERVKNLILSKIEKNKEHYDSIMLLLKEEQFSFDRLNSLQGKTDKSLTQIKRFVVSTLEGNEIKLKLEQLMESSIGIYETISDSIVNTNQNGSKLSYIDEEDKTVIISKIDSYIDIVDSLYFTVCIS